MMTESQPGSVTRWLELLSRGDPAAVEFLWRRYFQRMVRLASSRVRHLQGAVGDGEDVAISAFQGFCAAARRGDYAGLDSRESLWRVLVTCTLNRSRNLAAWETAKKRLRPSRQVSLSEAEPLRTGRGEVAEELVEAADQLQFLLQLLDTEDGSGELRQIALWKLEGLPNEQIAKQLRRRVSLVGQKIHLIRLLWEVHLRDE
jgi:DNA-directed RNA polymerase specialized sigma24 family protein